MPDLPHTTFGSNIRYGAWIASLPRRMMKVLAAAVVFTCVSMSALEKKVAPDRQIGRTEIRTLVQMFEYFHLRHDFVTDKDFARLIEVFLGQLDPDHAYFLQADASQFASKYGGSLVNSLRALGETAPADVIYDLYKTRVKERTAWIVRRMENWKLAPADDVSAPPPLSTWAPEQKSLDQYWEHRLRNEWALDVVQGSDPRKAAERIWKHYEMLAERIAARSADEVTVFLLNSFTALYDTHSVYYDAKTLANAAQAGTMKQVGIGVTLKAIGDTCVIENFFARMKKFRRISTRYDKLAATFVLFATALVWRDEAWSGEPWE